MAFLWNSIYVSGLFLVGIWFLFWTLLLLLVSCLSRSQRRGVITLSFRMATVLIPIIGDRSPCWMLIIELPLVPFRLVFLKFFICLLIRISLVVCPVVQLVRMSLSFVMLWFIVLCLVFLLLLFLLIKKKSIRQGGLVFFALYPPIHGFFLVNWVELFYLFYSHTSVNVNGYVSESFSFVTWRQSGLPAVLAFVYFSSWAFDLRDGAVSFLSTRIWIDLQSSNL